MNILFLTSTLPRFPGDMQAAFVLDQVTAWKAKRPGDRLIILAPHDAGAARFESMNGIEIRRFRYFLPERWQQLAYPAILPNIKRNPLLGAQVPAFLWAEYAAARRIIRDEKIDLIYAHWVMPQGIVARQLSKAANIPYVIQNHSSDLKIFSKFGGPGKALARSIIRDARAMFCVNSSQKDHALSLFDARERPGMDRHITVLPMGVVLDGFSPPENDAGPWRYDMGTISRLSRKKGLDLLIRAAEQLAADGIRPSVAIAGDGEDREALIAMPDEADIRFPGFLTGPTKAEFFRDTRHFVFPAATAGDDVEGLPVALLEALCSGKVVIASRDTNIEMLPEWDRLKQDIFFVEDPRDIGQLAAAMRELAGLDLAAQHQRAARLQALMKRYLWPNLIEEYLEPIGSAR